MPRIAEYTAPAENLSESTRGSASWEQAGRRIGPLYNETAQFQRQAGANEAKAKEDLLWPRNILKLYQETAAAKNAGTGIGLRSGREPRQPAYRGSPYDGIGQITRGAGALGNALRDGGYALADPTGQLLVPSGGELITDAADKELFRKYNSDLSARSSDYLNQLVNTRDYWDKYRGYSLPTDNIYDPSSTDRGPAPAAPPDPSASWFSGLADTFASGGGGNSYETGM